MYVWAKCTVVCFETAKFLDAIMKTTLILRSFFKYAKYKKVGHTSLGCSVDKNLFFGKSFCRTLLDLDKSRLATIYIKCSAPVACSVTFDRVFWAKIAGKSLFLPLSMHSSLVNSDSSLEMKPILPVIVDIKKRFAILESSLTSFMKQISKLAKRLDSLVLADQVGNIVIEESSDGTTGSGTAVKLDSFASFEIKRLKTMLEGLSALVLSLTTRFNSLILAGMNNLTKQKNIVCWHKDMNNLIINKFSGVCVFILGIDSGYLDSGVAVIMDNSLTRHVCKVFEISDWLFSIKLLFKNKLFVSILGLYASASSIVHFSQAGEINSLIAKAVNKSFFIILSGNFNENSSHRCASYKKCLDLDLINFLGGDSCNFCGVTRMIDFLFISSNLVNLIVSCDITDVMDYFDTDYKTIAISKFDVKNANVAKWCEFKDIMTANTTMFLDEFVKAVAFLDLYTIFHKLELLVSKLVKASRLVSSKNFASLLETWDKLDNGGTVKRIENFELDKGYIIRSMLECFFHKVVLDHLVVNNELVLEPELVKSKVDTIIEDWTRRHQVVNDIANNWSHQYQLLEYIFDSAFFGVMCLIGFDELYGMVFNLPDGKAASLSDISNKLWKHCDKSVFNLLLVLLNSCLACESVLSS
ncbi:hypothetical protein G9A89_000434 [Geosiphon pyriformis]|nr:hypothetical protein G9A89_000434 [Geosiphon pyriformis]